MMTKIFYGLGAMTVVSTAGDFYLRNFYWAFDREKEAAEGRPFKLHFVRYDRISKPAACNSTRPDTSWRKHAIFTPRNGAVIWARPAPEHEKTWLQLPPGDFIERVVCDIDLVPEIDESLLPSPMGRRNIQYFPKLLKEMQAKDEEQEAAALAATATAASNTGAKVTVAASKAPLAMLSEAPPRKPAKQF